MKHNIILASKSPRRKFLLHEIGIEFDVRVKETDETFPENLKAEQIPLYLSQKKAEAFQNEINSSELVITADTIVWVKDAVLNKPDSVTDAIRMLKLLSGNMHQVFTGVCLMSTEKKKSFFCESKVYFKKLTDKEIETYIENFKPFDKAGAYGAQECLPANMSPCSEEEINFLNKINKTELIENSINKSVQQVACEIVQRIEGSYFNVMGLPLHTLYQELVSF